MPKSSVTGSGVFIRLSPSVLTAPDVCAEKVGIAWSEAARQSIEAGLKRKGEVYGQTYSRRPACAPCGVLSGPLRHNRGKKE